MSMTDVAQTIPSISTTPANTHPTDATSTPNRIADSHGHNLSLLATTQSLSSSSQPPASTSAVVQPEGSQPAVPAAVSVDPHQSAQTAAITSTSPSSSEPGPSSPTEWGRNFWVTLVDPQSGTQFYACPSTGETTWDAPVGHFVLPPSSEGEWWELHDETRGGISYYYHTKTRETTWDMPQGFVIPLGVVQNTTLGRRLSQSTRRHSQLFPAQSQSQFQPQSHPDYTSHSSSSPSSHSHSHSSSPSSYKPRRTQRHPHGHAHHMHLHGHGPPSIISERTEEVTEDAGLSSAWEKENIDDTKREKSKERDKDKERSRTPTKPRTPTRQASSASTSSHQRQHPSPSRTRTKSQPNSSSAAASASASLPSPLSSAGQNQSLTAAAEYIVSSSETGTTRAWKEKERGREKSTPRTSHSKRSKQNGLEDPFLPTASSSPTRRPATASALNSHSHPHSSFTISSASTSTTSTSPSTTTTQQRYPTTSTPTTTSPTTYTPTTHAIIPEFSKLRKVASTTAATGVGVGTGTSLALLHAGVNPDGSSASNFGSGQGAFSTLPRTQFQARSFSASTPPSHVVRNGVVANGAAGTGGSASGKGKRDRRNTATGDNSVSSSGLKKIVIGPPVLDIEKTLAMSPMRLGDPGAPIHVNVLNSPLTPSFYSHSGGEGGRMSSSEQDGSGGGSGGNTSGPDSPVGMRGRALGLPGGSPLNGHGHGHYSDHLNTIDVNKSSMSVKRLSTGPHPLLPRELVSDIERFAQSDFAKKYFSTHKEGIFFKRRVPLEKMMSWQKAPLTQPLLLTPKLLHKDATKVFKSIQRIMGDRDRDRSPSTATNGSNGSNTPNNPSSPLDSSSSLYHLQSSTQALLEEERTLLNEGLSKGETLRDEIYCQLIKQLSGNPSAESTFRGWQLFCVLLVTFPPTKSFEPYVRGFLESHAHGDGVHLPKANGNGNGNSNGNGNGFSNGNTGNGGNASTSSRISLMARHCLTRLDTISKRGPRGKPPSLLEIEIASDAAFNPSTFGEPLTRIFKIQQRTYPALKIPIILPFLTDGILALGGTKAEGIFRVSGDAEFVSELRLRIDRGVYTLDGIDDPHVLASLFKLWLRELREPLIPAEMYNQCVACASDPERCVEMVKALPTLNRRVVLFVISFLQLFLDDRIYRATKMSAEALSLVVAPNLMRCASDVVGVVVNNARYEQQFICNLLLHLRCAQIDPRDYIPEHGRGALTSSSSRKSSNHGHGGGGGGGGNDSKHGHSRMQASESSTGSGSHSGSGHGGTSGTNGKPNGKIVVSRKEVGKR